MRAERGGGRLRPIIPGVVAGLGQYEGRADHDPTAHGEAGEHALAHGRSATACSRARRMNTVDVAPGAGWPMLRSPR